MNTHSATHECTNSRGQRHEGGNARRSGPCPGCGDPLRQQASLCSVGGYGRSVTGVPTRGTLASPRAPAAGRRGRRAAPRLASAGWAWPAAGGGVACGRRRAFPQQGGVRGSGWSFSINKDPDWIGGFSLSSGVRPFPVLSSPFGAPRYGSQEAEAPSCVRVGAPGDPAAGWRERAAPALLRNGAGCPVRPGVAGDPRLASIGRATELGVLAPAASVPRAAALPTGAGLSTDDPGTRGSGDAVLRLAPARPSVWRS
jgi:hypothetical protein